MKDSEIISPASVKQSADIKLTDDQKTAILNRWTSLASEERTNIYDMIKVAWGKTARPSSPEGLAVRRFLADQNIKISIPTKEQNEEAKYALDKNQKEFIRSNMDKMKALDLAKILYQGEIIKKDDIRINLIQDYVNSFKGQNKEIYDDGTVSDGYIPCNSAPEALKRIKEYVSNTEDWNNSFVNLTEKQKKCCRVLKEYLNNLRFVTQINTFSSPDYRNLFESTFIRCVYDKFDLTEEEVDQYIMYATEVVNDLQLTKSKNSLQSELDRIVDGDSDEERKMSANYVEYISALSKERNECIKRQNSLLDALKQKRSDKMANQKGKQISIVDLVEAWKQEDERQKLVKFAEDRKEKLRRAIEEYNNMDDVRARIFGISQEEVLNG